MGSVGVDEQGLTKADGQLFRHFNIDGLFSPGETCLPTALRADVLLTSWLIVLMRTREDRRASSEWAYDGWEDEVVHQRTARRLSTDEVLPGLELDNSLGDAIQKTSRHHASGVKDLCTATACPRYLLLSTGSLSKTSTDEQDEGTIHLEVRLDNGRLAVRPAWYSENVLPYTVALHVDILVDIIKMCLSNPGASVQSCMAPTRHDLDSIWRWCHDLPPTHDFCMQDMVTEQAQRHPGKVAIDAWDGTLTYGQIEQYSTSLAGLLRESGFETHDFVPLCFEKSRWTIVAVLAVMKAGATIAMMDPSLPLGRLQNMAVQVGAKTIVSSRMQHNLGTKILPEGPRFIVDEEAFCQPADPQTLPSLPAVPTTALMYIIFTSGSTGTPKGVKISHRTYTSSAIPRAAAVGYSEDSRVLDFASYAFDVSIDSMLLTLGSGGTLCIPSDEDRLNDINGVMRRMRINYAGITPSVARILEPDVIASLAALGLGGEASAPRDVNMWGRETRIVIGYGPCECTIGCTVNSSAATGRDYISIGPGNGASIWIVDPNDHDALVPVGAVGELLVEGPIVGQGYLNDDDKTAAAFIHDPPWLLAGHKGFPGRRGRLYKTGDLGMYDPDGSGEIIFAGRKDTQVKLRGQRVELGEIESQLRASLPSGANVIAEVIVPQASGGQQTLVAFVSQLAKVNGVEELEAAQLSAHLTQALSGINTSLAKVLPRYMVPNAYLPVNYIPTLISGKIDRKRLRQFGATVDLQKLDQGPAKATRESRELKDMEQRLRHAWGLVLKVAEDSIHPQDNFFSLGGESLAAMRLVSLCRERGLDLSVTSTFASPTLEEMADTVRVCDVDVQTETRPFSLITQSVDSACLEASKACGTDSAAVEDIYPCTPTQESLITFSLKATEPYVAQRVACIPANLSLDAFKQAWEVVFAANPILRTRVAQLQDPGLQQVVLRQGIDWRYSTSLSQYLEADRNERMDLGQSLARYAIVQDVNDGKRYFVWTVHHVQYDGWSEPLILDMVAKALQGGSIDLQPKALMKDFVRWVHDTDQTAMQDFWRNELHGAVGPQFPSTPSRDYLPTPDGTAERLIRLDKTDGLPFTMAALIRGAWALVASQYTGSDDVVFGETLTGRDISLRGVEGVLGPLNATVPVRVRIDRAAPARTYLAGVQAATSSRTPHQHMGMQYIRRVSRDAQHACEAPAGIVVQPEPELAGGGGLGFALGDPVREALHFNPYPLMLAFGLRRGGFRVCASFDKSLVDAAQMERVLAQLEAACARLTEDLDRRVGDVSCVPGEELEQIWRWNRTAPLAPERATGRLRAHGNIKPGSQYPRAAVPWVCDPRNPSQLSPVGCQGELWLESAVLTDDVVESPAWLVAGSAEVIGRAGKVQRTGDIVQLRSDGSLIFIGRRDDIMPVSGHAVNVADLEAHCARLLPRSARAAAAVFQPAVDGKEEAQDPELVMLIEQPQQQQEKSVELMFMRHDISCDDEDPDSFRATVCSEIPVSLAVALKKLDKFIRDDLASSLQPSAYVVVDRLPLENGHVARAVLNTFASRIASHVLGQLRDGYNKVWESLGQANLSASEEILRSAWAKLLGMRPEQIDVDDNFFRLGGDSVLAMKLVSGLRAQGHSLSVADIFQHMRLGDAARVLKVNSTSTTKALPYKPFSTLRVQNVDQFLTDVVRPKLAMPGWSIKDAAPVTDPQALDVRGTTQVPRTSVQYTMLHFDHGIDHQRLFRACKDLVKTHDILRTVFIEHESTFFQVVLNELDTPLITKSADEDIDAVVNKVCTEDIETDFTLGSSFFKLFHVEGKDGKHCLVIRLSHALYDGMSLPRLLEDLETLYSSGTVGDFEPFPSYIARTSDHTLQTKALSYWRGLLQDSSLSILDGQTTQPSDRGVFKEDVAIEGFQPPAEITTANLLTAAWALLLARRTGTADVTFGGVTSGRGIDMAGVEHVAGPCYQLTPIRVPFGPSWAAADLLRFVQRQSGESAAHDFVGLDRIASECAPWSGAAGPAGAAHVSFDSIVHHQDWDDAGSMPFAGTTARLDILNPHGDSPRPLKAVSFVMDGHLRVGVVGSERDAELVGAVLAELVAAVQELASSGDGQPLLGTAGSGL